MINEDTLDIAGFKSMSSTVFNAAQNKLNEVTEDYLKLDKKLTESKIKLAYRGTAPEFEIDTAFHTRIKIVDVRHDRPLRKNKVGR